MGRAALSVLAAAVNGLWNKSAVDRELHRRREKLAGRLGTPTERRRRTQIINIGAGRSYQRRLYAAKPHCRGGGADDRRALAIMGPSMLEREEEEKNRHSLYIGVRDKGGSSRPGAPTPERAVTEVRGSPNERTFPGTPSNPSLEAAGETSCFARPTKPPLAWRAPEAQVGDVRDEGYEARRLRTSSKVGRGDGRGLCARGWSGAEEIGGGSRAGPIGQNCGAGMPRSSASIAKSARENWE